MFFDFVEWDDKDDETGNMRHVAEHGITPDEVEFILSAADEADVFRSLSSGRPAVIGDTVEGRTLIVVFERAEDGGIVLLTPITAYKYKG